MKVAKFQRVKKERLSMRFAKCLSTRPLSLIWPLRAIDFRKGKNFFDIGKKYFLIKMIIFVNHLE